MAYSVPMSYTIQVWGIVSFIFAGFCQSLYSINGNQLHTFLFILTSTFGSWGATKKLISMLTYDQQDALGHFITVLLKNYENYFSKDLWTLFEKFNPHREFFISGSQYISALHSIPNWIKFQIVFKIISVFKFHEYNPKKIFETIAILGVCTGKGHVLMNLILNIINTFTKNNNVLCSAIQEEDLYSITLYFGNTVNHVNFHCWEDEIHMNIEEDVLRRKYTFASWPTNDTFQQMANDLIRTDHLKGDCPWIDIRIGPIVAEHMPIYRRIDFIISKIQYNHYLME